MRAPCPGHKEVPGEQGASRHPCSGSTVWGTRPWVLPRSWRQQRGHSGKLQGDEIDPVTTFAGTFSREGSTKKSSSCHAHVCACRDTTLWETDPAHERRISLTAALGAAESCPP